MVAALALLIKSLPTFSPRSNTGPYSTASFALQPGEPPLCHSPADCEILSLCASPWKIVFAICVSMGQDTQRLAEFCKHWELRQTCAWLLLLSHPGPEFVNRHLQFICFQTQTPIDRKFGGKTVDGLRIDNV